MFNFTCFNVEDPDDPQVGLFNGELSIPGNLLRREVFDPVVNQVRYLFQLVFARDFFWPLRVLCIRVWLILAVMQALGLIEDQMKKVNQRVDALLLVGGFSGSAYLFKKVEVSGVIIPSRKNRSECDVMTLGTIRFSRQSHRASLGC